jgi:membrane protein DedA with SNARE-associated domain
MDAVFAWVSHYGYAGLFALLMLGIVGLPVPDETLLVFCGYLIWTGRLHPGLAFLAGFLGSTCGITISYTLGRRLGRPLVGRYGKYIHLTEARFAKVNAWFDRIGGWLLAIGYFIPGVRHFTALTAGTSGFKALPFALFAYSGSAVWVAFFLGVGYVVGEEWKQASMLVERYLLLFLTAAVIIGALVLLWLRARQKKRAKLRNFANIS